MLTHLNLILLFFILGGLTTLVYAAPRYLWFGKTIGEDNPPFYYILFVHTVCAGLFFTWFSWWAFVYAYSAGLGMYLTNKLGEVLYPTDRDKH